MSLRSHRLIIPFERNNLFQINEYFSLINIYFFLFWRSLFNSNLSLNLIDVTKITSIHQFTDRRSETGRRWKITGDQKLKYGQSITIRNWVKFVGVRPSCYNESDDPIVCQRHARQSHSILLLIIQSSHNSSTSINKTFGRRVKEKILL